MTNCHKTLAAKPPRVAELARKPAAKTQAAAPAEAPSATLPAAATPPVGSVVRTGGGVTMEAQEMWAAAERARADLAALLAQDVKAMDVDAVLAAAQALRCASSNAGNTEKRERFAEFNRGAWLEALAPGDVVAYVSSVRFLQPAFMGSSVRYFDGRTPAGQIRIRDTLEKPRAGVGRRTELLTKDGFARSVGTAGRLCIVPVEYMARRV